jgi:lipoprotein-anchoring transpeptidase ErfK/SrfK
MNRRSRDIVVLAIGIAVVAAITLGGYLAVHSRAQGAVTRQTLAPLVLPSTGPSSTPKPRYERWMVGKALGQVVAYVKPSTSSKIKAKLGKVNQNGYPTLMLVDETREIGGRIWYKVSLAVQPNGSQGWVPEGKLAFFTTAAKITIDLSKRELSVRVKGKLIDTYPVAVGRPGLSTPTGDFFVNQKLRPPTPDGAYGVLAIGISAFQPKLPDWDQGGAVAIHGTNEPWLVGKAISHGCVRMRNKDILKVDEYVPAGSPVHITR